MGKAFLTKGGGGGGGTSNKKLAISELDAGTIVRIKEKGVETDYYLAQHDYQPSLNGSGRVLFVRKELHSKRQWHSARVNAYATSDIDAWLNGEFKGSFDADVREAMSETNFPYTIGNGNSTTTNLSRSVFFLSATEMGLSDGVANIEGTPIPIADRIKIATLNGTPIDWHTRTPFNTQSTQIFYIKADGTIGLDGNSGPTAQYGVRPCFTLPESSTILQEPNLDGSYTLSLGDDDPNKEYFKLTVVDGTTQPENPADNTIWVNTDVDMGLCYLAPNAPDSPEVGDVWVNTTNKYNSNGTNASTNLIRVNDNPYLEINVLNISQWDGSAWVNRDGSAIYANGAWTAMALYIFNYGTQNEAYPWKFGRKYLGSALIDSCLDSMVYGANYIAAQNAYVGDGSNGYGMIMTSVPVNVTNYNKYSFTVQRGGNSGFGYAGLSNISNPAINTISHQYWSQTSSGAGTSIATTDVDISSLTGEFYPCFRVFAQNAAYIYSLYVYMVCFTA